MLRNPTDGKLPLYILIPKKAYNGNHAIFVITFQQGCRTNKTHVCRKVDPKYWTIVWYY